MREKQWNFLNSQYDRQDIIKAAERLSVSPVIITLLYNRNICSDSEIKSFLSKSMKQVHDPYMLPDMNEAVDRIDYALRNNEKICIYGDYDVDGITATALMYRYLKEHGADVSYYIPERLTEGYGINIKAVNKISKTGCRLLITVDCGITSYGETELAKAQGMDVIITDHHSCTDQIPNAIAVVNPKREDSLYPFKELAGVGVALKMVLALALRFKEDVNQVFYKYSPLAAIGTVADVMSLVNENRIIVHRGIKSLNENKFVGINALAEIAGIKEFNAGTVSFAISPRINAAGRMGSPELAAELLLSEDEDKAAEMAQELNTENLRRRACEKDIFDEAEKLLKHNPELLQGAVIVLGGECWHQGVIGIVASRLCERYLKPVVMISFDGKTGHGSCRSVEGFNLAEALTECGDLLEKFGGHALAAGLTVSRDNFEEFTKKINQVALSKTGGRELAPVIDVDSRINPSLLTEANISTLWQLEPFGQGNPEPVFVIENLQVASAMALGDGGAHLKLQLIKNGQTLSAIAFRKGELLDKLYSGRVVDVAFTPEINCYNGRRTVQLRIEDIHLK